MKLALYFFRQYLPTFFFGFALFSFVFLLDKMFDLIDLILNKGVHFATVIHLMALFIPTSFPLAIPMAILLGCMVTFGRLSDENELTAVRAAGLSIFRVLWPVPVFALILSFLLVPFNTRFAPSINKDFRIIYEKIIHSDPLVKVVAKKFFSIKNIKIFTQNIDSESNKMSDLFVYQLPQDGRPAERIFARSGIVDADDENFNLLLQAGQLQRFDPLNPSKLVHVTFGEYKISVPLKIENKYKTTRFRNISTPELKKIIAENKARNFRTGMMEAEISLRYALAFAPMSLVLIGIPLATLLKRGGRAFNTGITLVVIFTYYLLLIFGLTLAQKGLLPSTPALWIANVLCMSLGITLLIRLGKH